MVSSFRDNIFIRAKTLSKTPPKVAGPPPATTFFFLSQSSKKETETGQTHSAKMDVFARPNGKLCPGVI